MEIRKNETVAVNTVELEIAVGAEEFADARQKAYRKNVGKISVPGFRRGKAPQRIIENIYGKSVFYEDAVQIATPQAYEKAVDEAKLEPVDQPKLEMLDLNDEGFVFKATVTVKPEVTLGDYRAIRVEKAPVEVTDADVDAAIDRLAQRNARMETVERPAQMGDTAVIDFEGFLDGTPFEGGKAERHELKLGSGSFIPGFEEQIIGKSAGEDFDVNVTFPEDYHSEELKGKAVVFKVHLHELRESILPTIDDEFAKDVSEFDSLETLRADEQAKLLKSRTQAAENSFESALLEKLAGCLQAEIPQVMVDQRIDRTVEEFGYRMQMQGINMEQYFQMTGTKPEEFREGFADRAAHQVKVSLALEAVAKQENITVSDEEIEAEYAKLAGENGKIEQMKSYISPEALRHDLSAEKALKLLKEIAAQPAASTEENAQAEGGEVPSPAEAEPAQG